MEDNVTLTGGDTPAASPQDVGAVLRKRWKTPLVILGSLSESEGAAGATADGSAAQS